MKGFTRSLKSKTSMSGPLFYPIFSCAVHSVFPPPHIEMSMDMAEELGFVEPRTVAED